MHLRAHDPRWRIEPSLSHLGARCAAMGLLMAWGGVIDPMYVMHEVDLVFRHPVMEGAVVSNASDAYALLLPAYSEQLCTREIAVALYLDGAGQVRGLYRVSAGGLAGTVVDPRLLFVVALKVLASSVILSHNHPSGQRLPSREDVAMTAKLQAGARLLDLRLIDHLIMTDKGFFSMDEAGLLP